MGAKRKTSVGLLVCNSFMPPSHSPPPTFSQMISNSSGNFLRRLAFGLASTFLYAFPCRQQTKKRIKEFIPYRLLLLSFKHLFLHFLPVLIAKDCRVWGRVFLYVLCVFWCDGCNILGLRQIIYQNKIHFGWILRL